jgi:hypothetical protein
MHYLIISKELSDTLIKLPNLAGYTDMKKAMVVMLLSKLRPDVYLLCNTLNK